MYKHIHNITRVRLHSARMCMGERLQPHFHFRANLPLHKKRLLIALTAGKVSTQGLLCRIYIDIYVDAYECENFPTINAKYAWTRSSLVTVKANSNSNWNALNSVWALQFTGITSFKSSWNYLQVLQIKCDLYKCEYKSDFMFMRRLRVRTSRMTGGKEWFEAIMNCLGIDYGGEAGSALTLLCKLMLGVLVVML